MHSIDLMFDSIVFHLEDENMVMLILTQNLGCVKLVIPLEVLDGVLTQWVEDARES